MTLPNASNDFSILADQALGAMKACAEQLNIKGVAVVAYSQGQAIESCTSKMLIVGRLTGPSNEKDPNGANFLGIAYAKVAEMVDTLKHSGSNIRPPKTGEYGWQGGTVIKSKTGFLFAAFSGGPSADDLKISNAGLETLGSIL